MKMYPSLPTEDSPDPSIATHSQKRLVIGGGTLHPTDAGQPQQYGGESR